MLATNWQTSFSILATLAALLPNEYSLDLEGGYGQRYNAHDS